MLVKDYQVDITKQKFQGCRLFSLHDDRTILSTTTLKLDSESHFDVQPPIVESHNSYLYNKGTIKHLLGLGIMDVYNKTSQRSEQLTLKQNKVSHMLYKQPDIYPQQFDDRYQEDLSQMKIVFAEGDSKAQYFLNQTQILIPDLHKQCIYLDDLNACFNHKQKPPKRSQHRQRRVILDLLAGRNREYHLRDVAVLNSNQCLVISNSNPDSFRYCTRLFKFDIPEQTIEWKLTTISNEAITNLPVPLGQNSLLICFYNLEDNVSSLQLFDYRVQGPVLKILQSNSEDILRESINRNLDPKFDILCQLDLPYQFFSILTYRSGAKSLPYLMDIRKPQNIEFLKLQTPSDLSHVRGIHYNKGRLISIEREFRQYTFSKAMLREYHLSS